MILLAALALVAVACSPLPANASPPTRDLEAEAQYVRTLDYAVAIDNAKRSAWFAAVAATLAARQAAAEAPEKQYPWPALAQCEASGDWHINNGNGYHGGLQFHPGTWRSYGGTDFAAYAYQASPTQQVIVAKRVLAATGWSYRASWPGCSRKLGLA